MTARFSFVLFLALAFQPLTSFAHEHHTDNVCSVELPALCAHAGYAKDFTTSQGNEFMFHFMAKAPVDAALLTDVEISVQLPAADGDQIQLSNTVQQLDGNHFLVSEIAFPKPGAWEIHAVARYQGQAIMIVIPIQVLLARP